VSCKFGQEFANAVTVLGKQFPLQTIREETEGKCVHNPCQTTVVHKLYDIYHDARLNFVNW